jgi:NhaP-type Na+/H+ or K+/H+ antiporter
VTDQNGTRDPRSPRTSEKPHIPYINISSQLLLIAVAIRGPVSFALALHIPLLNDSDPSLTAYCMSVILFGQFFSSFLGVFLMRRFDLSSEPQTMGLQHQLSSQTENSPAQSTTLETPNEGIATASEIDSDERGIMLSQNVG